MLVRLLLYLQLLVELLLLLLLLLLEDLGITVVVIDSLLLELINRDAPF